MDHLIQPLETLLSRAGVFAAERGLRLLHVAADAALYRDVLRTLATLEWSPRNRQHFIDATPPGDGPADWGTCQDRLVDQYQRIRVAYAGRGLPLPELPARTAGEPVVGFGGAMQWVAARLSSAPAPTDGIVVVLGVGAFVDRRRAAEQIASLVESPTLARVRWILVEPGDPALGDLIRRMGPAGIGLACRVDRERQRREIDGLLDAMTTAPVTAVGPARVGGAKPAVAPPTRTGAPPAREPLPTVAHVPLFLQGVKALRGGDLPRAVQFQREAVASCLAANHTAVAIEMETLLAVYLGQFALANAQSIRPAVDTFEQAIAKAVSAGLPSLGARAAMLQGVIANAGGDGATAVLSLHRAALLAETAGVAELQSAALRLAADLVSRAGLDERAAELRERATRGEAAQRSDASGRGD